jgi:phenylacetate-CoA ligase
VQKETLRDTAGTVDSDARERIVELGVNMMGFLGRLGALQVFECYFELNRNLRKGESQLRDYQNRRLRRIVHHAYDTVPFYRDLFNSDGIKPEDVRNTSDLNRLPIINKSVLRKADVSQKLSRSFAKKSLQELCTGGSTGEPFRLYISKREASRRGANWFRICYLHGCSVFDKRATVAGLSGRVKSGWLNKLGLVRKIEVPFDFSLSDQVKTLVDEEPDILEGYPSRIHVIAKYIIDNGIAVKKPRAIFVDSETLFPAMRETIEQAFGVRVTNIYDSYEFGYTAWECNRHKGLHINADSQIVQIVRDGVEVDDGQSGEIVITNLDNYAMPLIRYSTGDIGVKSKRKCECGIAFPLLENVLGRKWDFLLSPSGEEIPPLLVEQFVRKRKGVLEYRIVQNSRQSLDVELVVSEDYDHAVDSQIADHLRALYGFKEVVIHHPSRIERTLSGKLRCVVRNC